MPKSIYLRKKHSGGAINQRGNDYEICFACLKIMQLTARFRQYLNRIVVSSQGKGYVDDFWVQNRVSGAPVETCYQLKTSAKLSWGKLTKQSSLSFDFHEQKNSLTQRGIRFDLELVVSKKKSGNYNPLTMRQLSKYAQDSGKIKSLLDTLLDRKTQSEEYADAFYQLGGALSDFIQNNKFLTAKTKVTLACSSEDADWLSKGILDRLEKHVAKINLAVFWNIRSNAFENTLPIAPIIKTYIESLENVDVLIICKSIINTSCVVKTNLTYLIERITPKKIFIVSPVLFEKAIPSLENEFPKSVSDKFEFFYFAEDNEVTESGEVVPGIGGSVYRRLGLEDAIQKNKYIPVIVKKRREANQPI